MCLLVGVDGVGESAGVGRSGGEFCPHQTGTHISSDGSRAGPVPVRNTSQLSESELDGACTRACTYAHAHKRTGDNIRRYIKGCYFNPFLQLYPYKITVNCHKCKN